MVINLSDFMVSWWWLILLETIASGVALIMTFKRSVAFQHFVDRMLLKLPVIGELLHNSAIARSARTLAVTLKAGVPLVEGLATVPGAPGNTVSEKAVNTGREDVTVGYPAHTAKTQDNTTQHPG